MSRLLLIPMFVAVCFARDSIPAKPACNAENLHKIWPEKTDQRPGVPVAICVAKHRRYSWQPLTVDISELRALAKSNPASGRDRAPAAAHE